MASGGGTVSASLHLSCQGIYYIKTTYVYVYFLSEGLLSIDYNILNVCMKGTNLS